MPPVQQGLLVGGHYYLKLSQDSIIEFLEKILQQWKMIMHSEN